MCWTADTFSGENLKALQHRDVYMPDQQYVRLAGGKTKPEDRDGLIGPPPVKSEEPRHAAGETLAFNYHGAEDCFLCPQAGKLCFARQRVLKGVAYRSYRKYGCGRCELRATCIGTSKNPTRKELWVRVSELSGLQIKAVSASQPSGPGPTGFELALAMRAKLSTPEGKAIYARRFPVSEGAFAVIKGLREGYRFLRCRLDRVREEWAERCIAHNLAKLVGFTLCKLTEW